MCRTPEARNRKDMTRRKITFLPSERAFFAEKEENLLELAMNAGVHINASCGGNGACGKCRVRVVEGEVSSPSSSLVTTADFERGIRLACVSLPESDVMVEIPLESQVDRGALQRKREAPHILSAEAGCRLVAGMKADPYIFKEYLQLPEPTAEDNAADLDRVKRVLRERLCPGPIWAGLKMLRKLSVAMRAGDWNVTVTVWRNGHGYELLDVEPGRTGDTQCAIVIDIGTTTICGQLLDMGGSRRSPDGGSGEDNSQGLATLAEYADYNRQISFGEDVISRIMYTRKKQGLKKLQEAVVSTINGVVAELLKAGSRAPEDVSHCVFAGNTTMTHLVLGIDPKHIMLAPYTPVSRAFPPARAGELGLKVNGYAPAVFLPSVSSYVGGDIVAGVLGTNIFKSEEVTLFIDLGTNGEIVVGNKDWLVCASSSAGPAFEGGGIRFGMRAGRGAIEQVGINPSTLEPMLLTVGKTKPMGICGSGLIDLVAGLFEGGLIDRKGKFFRNTPTGRVRPGLSGYEYVVAWAAETGIGEDIAISEVDLDNLMRTKAALYAGCRVLLETVGLTFRDIGAVVIAGGFGHYIDPGKAQAIGLLPELPLDRFLFVGNASLLGARLVAASQKALDEAERVAGMMTNVELSNSPGFMDEFVAAMFLPHTDEQAFPGVIGRQTYRGGD
jgi:uncharacterized 2Fe-2S/4Fe-4S cluster protein (DUF4445 family)